ncbi:hypothetical protein [Arenibaculum pallidiluteum]|uniref:hypothetical protein n=1 Tax=Arenibaculum pallidiluteum TaxID=2812559 RepID=UPI001A9762A6|nr:hypothetical protein [Arenibaculum pallidiluteum]
MKTLGLFVFPLVACTLAACGPVELVASGISDGTKYVVKQTNTQSQGQPAQAAPATGQRPATQSAAAQDRAAPPVTAAPVAKIGKAEPLP